jgi:hypothetical protein
MHTLVVLIGLLIASNSVFADSFEFAGISRSTTAQNVAKQYPHSSILGNHIKISPQDAHDHIFGIELFEQNSSHRLRINFESPDHTFPACEAIKKSIVLTHGLPTAIRNFNEESMQNRYLLWKLNHETVQLQCFMADKKSSYFAEAIVVYPTEK